MAISVGPNVPDLPLVVSSTVAANTTTSAVTFPATAIPGRNCFITSITVAGTGATAGSTVAMTLTNIVTQGSTTGTLNMGYAYANGATTPCTQEYIFPTPLVVGTGLQSVITVTGAAGNTGQSTTVVGYAV